MDAEDLKALLEAAARELLSVVNDLPNENYDQATYKVTNEIGEARKAIEQAVVACEQHMSCQGAAVQQAVAGGVEPESNEVLREARSLRAEAVRARDVAEARLWALQDEHTELLEKLRQLSAQHRQRLEEQHMEADSAASKENVLVERCHQLDNQVRALRKDVDAKSQRLIASSTLGHSLELSKRKLQRQHEGSLVENAVAREILALQQSTEAYLQKVNADVCKVDQSLETAQKQCSEKLEGLQSEWGEQQAKYQADMSSLENRLLELQQDYEERWRKTDETARQVVNTKSQQATQAMKTVEEEILLLDVEKEKEAIASRELVEEQNQIMEDARQAALVEMQAKLDARQNAMAERVDSERRRCDMIKNRYAKRTVECQQEVLKYKSHITELSLGYHRKPQRGKPSSARGSGLTPRGSIGGGSNVLASPAPLFMRQGQAHSAR